MVQSSVVKSPPVVSMSLNQDLTPRRPRSSRSWATHELTNSSISGKRLCTMLWNRANNSTSVDKAARHVVCSQSSSSSEAFFGIDAPTAPPLLPRREWATS